MPKVIVPTFPIECYVKNEFLFNHEEGFETFTACRIIGMVYLNANPIMFHIILENGALFSNIPIHALTMAKSILKYSLNELQPFNCLGHDFSLIEFTYLKDCTIEVYIKKIYMKAKYIFSIYPYHSDPQEICTTLAMKPDEQKTLHFLELENGLFGAYPNQFLKVNDNCFTKPYQTKPGYKSNTRSWNSEFIGSW